MAWTCGAPLPPGGGSGQDARQRHRPVSFHPFHHRKQRGRFAYLRNDGPRTVLALFPGGPGPGAACAGLHRLDLAARAEQRTRPGRHGGTDRTGPDRADPHERAGHPAAGRGPGRAALPGRACQPAALGHAQPLFPFIAAGQARSHLLLVRAGRRRLRHRYVPALAGGHTAHAMVRQCGRDSLAPERPALLLGMAGRPVAAVWW